jgi:hypothetical protein
MHEIKTENSYFLYQLLMTNKKITDKSSIDRMHDITWMQSEDDKIIKNT